MASQSSSKAIKENSLVKMILKGVLVAYVITIPAFLVFSFVMSFSSYPEKMITPVVYVTTIISILVAGIVSAKRLKRRGWINGGMVGLVYVIVLYILGSIIYKDFALKSSTIYVMITGILTGALGGIIGINMKKK